MTSYDRALADTRLAEEQAAAMLQPLDVAVLAVRTTWVREDVGSRVPAAIVRSGYFGRLRALSTQVHDSHVSERGS